MNRYLLIESREPEESPTVLSSYELAADLAARGHDVSLFLVQNGVFAVRTGGVPDALARATSKGVKVLADDFSLRERGIAAPLAAGAKPSPIDVVVERMVDGSKVTWH
jgi:sulfur relay (sulfurtransferase) complex TusBCD TusD component (DsrE family)